MLSQEWEWYRIFGVQWHEVSAVIDALERLYSAPSPVYRVLADPPVPPPCSTASYVKPEKLTGATAVAPEANTLHQVTLKPGSEATGFG